jgi:hypothetical protein
MQSFSIKSEDLNMEWEFPTNVLTDALQSFGEFEWGKGGIAIREDEDWNCPPSVVWRYKDRVEKIEKSIVKAVNSFQGNVNWTIVFSGRNWFITPRKYQRFLEDTEFEPGVNPRAVFASQNPEIGLMANKELPQLAEHIKKTVQEALGVSIN